MNACGGFTSFAGSRVPVVLVGNKNDLHLERVVSTDQGRRLADHWKAVFLETSAKEHEVRPCSCVLGPLETMLNSFGQLS